ncbi:MAG: DUF296 domain-containing protein [Candidatus Methanoperedens sp.]|jgi:hypothetical protein|nr:DUF296 domain-containing protein [Candidatus Methanoperedens sp.]PKL54317.1 MAG: DNA-binding protein [Candidatus Methanoperedenaceae archaeon HGW-Methanoperedenaceae-1]
MDYRKGSIGRLFVVRIDHGEDLLGELTGLAVKEDIKSGFFIMLGAMGSAELVTGPEEKVVPPIPVWHGFDDAREVIGIGNIFRENGKPKIHLHGAVGNSKNLTMGCIRKNTEAFMVVEVMIIEIDIAAERIINENVGYSPVTFR